MSSRPAASGPVQHGDRIWSWSAPHAFYGLHLGTRMTAVRLAGGGLWVHSPIAATEAVVAALRSLGEVRHVVCPNLFHHVYAGDLVRAFPGARLHGPAGLRKKRPDLRIDAELSAAPHPDWAADLVPVPIDGSALQETVFVHPRSRTLVSSDLLENFASGSGHLPTDLYLRLGGVYGRPGWHRALRLAYRDRRAARASVDRLLQHEFDRVILAHGEVVERDGREVVREALAWLRP